MDRAEFSSEEKFGEQGNLCQSLFLFLFLLNNIRPFGYFLFIKDRLKYVLELSIRGYFLNCSSRQMFNKAVYLKIKE